MTLHDVEQRLANEHPFGLIKMPWLTAALRIAGNVCRSRPTVSSVPHGSLGLIERVLCKWANEQMNG